MGILGSHVLDYSLPVQCRTQLATVRLERAWYFGDRHVSDSLPVFSRLAEPFWSQRYRREIAGQTSLRPLAGRLGRDNGTAGIEAVTSSNYVCSPQAESDSDNQPQFRI